MATTNVTGELAHLSVSGTDLTLNISGAQTHATSSGTDTITLTLTNAPTAYAAGQVFTFKAGGTNTGATTININSLGAKTIQKLGSALAASDITTNDLVSIGYDGTQFQLLSPVRSLSGGSGTFSDASFTLQDNGDATKQLQFQLSGVTAGTTRTLTVPDASTTLVGTDATQTLSNKTLSTSTLSGTTTLPGSGSLDSSGRLVLPAQPAFSAYLSASTSSDKTGDGTSYTVIFDSEIFDQNSNYNNSTGVFTAPVTGRYQFNAMVDLNGPAAAHTLAYLRIVTSNRTYEKVLGDPSAVDSNGQIGVSVAVLADMDASDTAYVTVLVLGSTKTVGLYGGSSMDTSFSGFLAC